MVLFIACANATNLLLAQTVARRPELALRASLGASRARLVQLVLVQTLVLGGIAGVAGLFASRLVAPPLLRLHSARLTVVAQIGGASPAAVLRDMKHEVARLDPNLVLITGTLADQLAFALFPARAAGYALGATGILGLLLALTGLGAVIAQSVAQRTREIGIRMALGARRFDVLAHIVREGAILLAIGVAVGTVLALGATRVLSGLLYGISASDPATFVTVIALLAATALGACLLGARRATRVDPMIAMSSDG